MVNNIIFPQRSWGATSGRPKGRHFGDLWEAQRPFARMVERNEADFLVWRMSQAHIYIYIYNIYIHSFWYVPYPPGLKLVQAGSADAKDPQEVGGSAADHFAMVVRWRLRSSVNRQSDLWCLHSPESHRTEFSFFFFSCSCGIRALTPLSHHTIIILWSYNKIIL